MRRAGLLLGCLVLTSSCATRVPVLHPTAVHPASADAPEAQTTVSAAMLGEDPQDGAKKPLSTTKAPVSHEGHSPGKSDAGGGETTESSGNPGLSVRFTCPMHPDVVSDKPGKCPKCGMSLVPKERPK